VTVVIGVDPHKQTHTAMAVRSGTGELVGERTAAARAAGHEELLRWAEGLSADRLWALEDVRSVSRGLERLLVARGERVIRVPPKLMAGARRGARSFGKSDSIDALAIARAALGHPDLPVAFEDRRRARSSCSSIIARPSSGSAPRPRTGCGGCFTPSIPR